MHTLFVLKKEEDEARFKFAVWISAIAFVITCITMYFDTDEILLADTGVNSNIVLVVSSIAVVALVAVIAIKKFANA